MSEALLPLVGVVVGALAGCLGSIVTETTRARHDRRAALRDVRRSLQLDALDEVHRTITSFHEIFAHNHDGTSKKADIAQATAVESHFLQLSNLRLRAHRIDVVASPAVARRVVEVSTVIEEYFTSLATSKERVFRGAQTDAIAERLHQILESMKNEIRRDLRSSRLD